MSGSRPPASSHLSSTGLDPKVASALAYLAGPFSGALLLAVERSNANVRFHAWQSVLALGGLGVLVFALGVLAFASLFMSATAFRVLLWLMWLFWGGWIVLWVICLLKVYRGEPIRLPLVGDYAERRAQLPTPNP